MYLFTNLCEYIKGNTEKQPSQWESLVFKAKKKSTNISKMCLLKYKPVNDCFANSVNRLDLQEEVREVIKICFISSFVQPEGATSDFDIIN